ncbi:Carbamoyl-phosphate synthase L chain, ATP binding domain-containing protein [Cladophialophora immunda]|nr:Carbamoyl-phosphate synthase L chain, ATP binding domain-containing protein [Cladophialophora immunda]
MELTSGIRRLLVANRGEIAIRIISSARELGIHTVAIYTKDDENHAIHADEAVCLKLPEDFMNGKLLTQLCLDHQIDSVHPGYGFLSENADFAESLETAGIRFIGPTPEILRRTGDKTTARALAESCNVPVLPALKEPIAHLEEASGFISATGFPLMIKAVDGGGGRGIRLVSSAEHLKDGFDRARGESPGGKVFIEKAAVDGYRHVEVQIIGDGRGQVAHLWERECSIQRRFQKMVELAPSTIQNRELIATVIESAINVAKSIRYRSLGTFEYLVHESRPEFYFLEVNPRLQVEHTVTEEITNVDLVRDQLLIAQGATIDSLGLPSREATASPQNAPKRTAIQLRVTAEDPVQGFTLSMGRISQFHCPGGRGVRIETHLSGTRATVVGSSFDSLLAKVIVSTSTREESRRKGLRALCDLAIHGVKTNLPVLLGTLASADFQKSACSTTWLEKNLPEVLKLGQGMEASTRSVRQVSVTGTSGNEAGSSTAGAIGNPSNILFKKGDAFRVKLSGLLDGGRKTTEEEHVIVLDRIMNNDFPNLIAGDVSLLSGSSEAKKFTASLAISTTGSNLASSHHRKGDPSNPNHVVLPFAGVVVELLAEAGDEVQEGEVLMVVRQMKMELEVRAPAAGVLTWVCDVEEGENVGEGMLVCELEPRKEKTPAGALGLAAKL